MILFESSMNSCTKQPSQTWLFVVKICFSLFIRLGSVANYFIFLGMERWNPVKLSIALGILFAAELLALILVYVQAIQKPNKISYSATLLWHLILLVNVVIFVIPLNLNGPVSIIHMHGFSLILSGYMNCVICLFSISHFIATPLLCSNKTVIEYIYTHQLWVKPIITIIVLGTLIDFACFYSFDELTPFLTQSAKFTLFITIFSSFLAILVIGGMLKRVQWANVYKELFHSE